MSLQIDSFLKAAESGQGIGYVKLSASSGSPRLVQYGNSFCARVFGWFRRPSEEQNKDVRTCFLKALADSAEDFCEEAVNNAAMALGLRDVLPSTASLPLSKREVLKVIDMTRIFDRNQKLGLYKISEGQVDRNLREQFRRVRAGSDPEDARNLIGKLNLTNFSYEDVHRRVAAKLNIPPRHPLTPQLEILSTQIKKVVEKHLESQEVFVTGADREALIDREVDRYVTDKLQAYQLLLDFSDPEKTAEPFSSFLKDIFLKSCTSSRAIPSGGYVRALYDNRSAARPFLRALSAENPGRAGVAEAFADFALCMKRIQEDCRLEEELAWELAGDLMRVAADDLKLPSDAKMIQISAAGQKIIDDLWQELDFLSSNGAHLPGVTLPPDGRLAEFDLLSRVAYLICRELNGNLEKRIFDAVSPEVGNLVKKLGTEIKDMDPFGKGPVAGVYGPGMRKFILEDLENTAGKILNQTSPEKSLEDIIGQMVVDIRRGYGLVLGEKVVNGVGVFNHVDSRSLAEDMKNFFTVDGRLDRRALVAVSSFAHQGMALCVLACGAQAGYGPFTEAVSVDDPRSLFRIFRNDDQSYSIRFRSDITGIRHFGIFGTPGHVTMDGDGRNRFSCELAFRMSFQTDTPVFAFEQNPSYEYEFAPRLSEEDIDRLNRQRIAEYGTEENIDREFQRYLSEEGMGERPPLTAEEKQDLCRGSIREMQQRAENQGLVTAALCRGAILLQFRKHFPPHSKI